MTTRIDLVNSADAPAGTTLRMNDGTADADGNLWNVQQLTGWGSRQANVQTAKRMATDGVIVTNATYGPRLLTLTGVAVIAATSDWWEAMARFESACDHVTADGKVRVYEPGGTRHAGTRLQGQPRIQFMSGSPRSLSWSVTFLCPDPDLQAGA